MNTILYLLGIILVTFGIIFLFFIGAVGAFSAVAEYGFITALLILGVSILIGTPSIFFGMRLVRYSEKNRSQKTSNKNINQAQPALEQNRIEDWKNNFANFDISRLNIWGWLVFLSTILFLMIEIWVMVYILKVDMNQPGRKIYMAIACLFGGGYYKLATVILNKFNIRIFRKV